MLESNQGVPVVGAATVLNKCVSFFNAALTAGHWKVVHAMLNAGMDVLSQGAHGITPLKHMYTSCAPATVSQLLGCVPGSKSGLGVCSVDLVQRNMVDMLKVFKAAGADLGCAVDGASGANALMLAAQSTVATQLATVLLDSGVPVDSRDNQGRTALFHVMKAKKYRLVRLLLSRGADAMAEDNMGLTVLMLQSGAKAMLEVITHVSTISRV
jgi:ankyrin repeat protein